MNPNDSSRRGLLKSFLSGVLAILGIKSAAAGSKSSADCGQRCPKDFEPQPAKSAEPVQYTYDSKNRITGVTDSGVPSTTYHYDWNGNRLNPPE